MVDLTIQQKTLVVSCLADRLGDILNKADRLRRMKGAIDDEAYDKLVSLYEYELQLLTDAQTVVVESQAVKNPSTALASYRGLQTLQGLLYHEKYSYF